ncbi:MAG: AMP-binding protein, partial [Acidobacteriota bacterium]
GKTGIVLVTLGTRLTAAELEHMVRDSGMRALLYDDASAETVAALRELLKERPAAVDHWVAFDRSAENSAPENSAPENSAPEAAENRVDYHAAVAELPEASDWRPTPCDPEDLCCLLYTSGTTGLPKGVMIPHRMVVWNGFNTVTGWQLRADDVSPIFTPLYHAGGLMAFLVPIVTIGGTIVLHSDFDAESVWRSIEEEACTVVLGVPTIWKMLLESPSFARADLSHLRWLISGGAPLPHYLIEAYQAKGVVFKQGFGMTEVGVNCFAMTVDDSYRKPGSIGKPMMHTEVRLVDDDGRDVADDEVGELLFRGPHVCAGYWHNEDATARALDADGWFHSGDLARRDTDGYFYVAGREKDMIISGGVNVYPAEIEAALLLHPEVEDVAVVGVPDERWDEAGIAFVKLRPGGPEATADALDAFLGERLARFKLPKGYRFVDELPRTAYGKVVKGELKDRFLEESA